MARVCLVAVIALVSALSCSGDRAVVSFIKANGCGKGCAPVDYFNKPWHFKVPGELIEQPKCIMNLGTDPIEPGKLQLSIVFHDPIDDIIQWSFKKVKNWTFTNADTFYAFGDMEFQFQVVYNGTEDTSSFTFPPIGFCLFSTV